MPLAMAIHRFGLANLRPGQRGAEALGAGLVRVAIKAVSLNYRDVLVLRGTYGAGAAEMPLIPCSDAAGVVLEVGPGVGDFTPGDRVCTHMVPDWQDGRLEPQMRLRTLGGPAQGVLCEERVLPRTALVPIPSTLPFEHAACLPVAGLAAWSALTSEASIGPGHRVLLLGTGGVSMLGLQIAKTLGAEVAVVSSSEDKLGKVRTLGADFTANYRRPGWGELECGGGAAAGSTPSWRSAGTRPSSSPCARPVIAAASPSLASWADDLRPISFTEILLRRIRVQGVFVGSRAELERYVAFVEAHRIHPLIDRVFEGLAAARQAFAYLVTGRHLGKVVIRV